MELAYLRLLAFDGIQESVDKAFRALLDVYLLDLARAAPDSKLYLEHVQQLRREELYNPPIEEDAVVGLIPRESADDLHAYKAGFLYWFDLRTIFWWEQKRTGQNLDALISTDTLRWIYQEVSALQQRVKAVEHVQAEPTGYAVDSSAALYSVKSYAAPKTTGAARSAKSPEAESEMRRFLERLKEMASTRLESAGG